MVTRDQRRGAEAAAVDLAQLLQASGDFVTDVVALAPAAEGAPLGVEVMGSNTLGPGTLLRLRRRAAQADIVVGHGSRSLPAIVMACGGLPARRVYQSIGDPTFWTRSGPKRLRVGLELRRLDGVAALTKTAALVFEDIFKVAPDRLHVVPNWRDSTVFRPAEGADRCRARTSLGLPGTRDIVVVIGALSPEKDVALAIAAASARPNTTLLVVGDGPELPALRSRAARSPGGDVRFLGALNDVRHVLHASDVLMLTSHSEGMPGVLIEAGMTGLPVVAMDVGFVRDVVVDNESGILVRDRDATALVAALDQAVSRKAELGGTARRHCADEFDSSVVLQRWRSLFASLLA